ncbi:MAG: DUF4411 family protein [Hyphomonadaceae bacterium]|nr:DUF4411 family protein [Hyphomonadaceae bacterium]
MTYLLDSNVFIEAENRCYGLDFCPAFWDWLKLQNRTGKVASVAAVAEELRAGRDELKTWARERGKTFFLEPDGLVLTAMPKVSDWVVKNYERAAVSDFLSVADSWLVAHALAHKHIVVTHERPANTRRKVKIPNVCKYFNINCTGPYEMLRREGANFILGPSRKTQ